jgi:hypothetical protein
MRTAAVALLALCAGAPVAAAERLLAEPPEGWVRTDSLEQGSLRLTEFTPRGETAVRWRAKVSFEAIEGTPLPDPEHFLADLEADQRGACDVLSRDTIFSGSENGFPTAVGLFLCQGRKLSGNDQVTLVKAIRGDASLYVVSRAERFAPEAGAPLEARVAEIALYLRAITVCDPNAHANPCPAP